MKKKELIFTLCLFLGIFVQSALRNAYGYYGHWKLSKAPLNSLLINVKIEGIKGLVKGWNVHQEREMEAAEASLDP